MGIPKFYRCLSERYPKMNQRVGVGATPVGVDLFPPGGGPSDAGDTNNTGVPPPVDTRASRGPPGYDSVSRPGPSPPSPPPLLPPFDNLYLDMNGILHGCSHANDPGIDADAAANAGGGAEAVAVREAQVEARIMQNVAYYVDRIVSTVKPRQVLYMAVDGVAPRAKLNQQRSRRFRARKDLLENRDRQRRRTEGGEGDQGTGHDPEKLRPLGEEEESAFHSNAITPGTVLMDAVSDHVVRYARRQLRDNPLWENLTVIYSGPDVPGEGEHKIMSYIRNDRRTPGREVGELTHCVHSQDGDLVLLGLATHEPNLCLLREEVKFNVDHLVRTGAMARPTVEDHVLRSKFELLHMNVLRDYLELDLASGGGDEGEDSWDLERTVDDFVFMTFFIGNDFLPHLPALDIEDHAFDLLFRTYKEHRYHWATEGGGKKNGDGPYLTHSGKIVSGLRLEKFLQSIAKVREEKHLQNRHHREAKTARLGRMLSKKFGRTTSATYLPSDVKLAADEATNRREYEEMLGRLGGEEGRAGAEAVAAAAGFVPVVAGKMGEGVVPPAEEDGNGSDPAVAATDYGPAGILDMIARYIFPASVPSQPDPATVTAPVPARGGKTGMEDEVEAEGAGGDYKGRYYHDKFRFTPLDVEKHRALRKSYVEGLVWNLEYYYGGCVSWSWYYPYHYGPMLSDIVNVDEILEDIDFQMGEPLRPFEQLLGCMPPSSAYLLPAPYRELMTSPTSPLKKYYPDDFRVDMNGKMNPWEGVALLSFIDIDAMLSAAAEAVAPERHLTQSEVRRNARNGTAVVLTRDVAAEENLLALPGDAPGFGPVEKCMSRSEPFDNLAVDGKDTGRFVPKILPGTRVPHPQFFTLKSLDVSLQMRRTLGINVFGSKSRYRTAVIAASMGGSGEDGRAAPDLPPASAMAPHLVGTVVYVGYPYLQQALVTSVSDPDGVASDGAPTRWNSAEEAREWAIAAEIGMTALRGGEGVPGSGGLQLPHADVVLTVRPLAAVETLEDGSRVRVFSRVEMDVPLLAALASPPFGDPRLEGTEMAVEEREDGEVAAVVDPGTLGGVAAAYSRDTVPDFGRAKLSSARMLSTVPFINAQGRNGAKRPPSTTKCRHRPGAAVGTGRRHLHTLLARPRLGSRRSVLGVAAATFAFAGSSVWQNAHAAGSTWGTGRPTQVRSGSSEYFGIGARSSGDTNAFDSAANPDGENVHGSAPPLEFAHGTTTLSFIFGGGIVVAVDSRASMGQFVGSKTTQKVLPVSPHILGTMAGGAADCSYWIRQLQSAVRTYEMGNGSRKMSVARASRILSNSLYEARSLDLSMGTMIAGFDYRGPSLYYVDDSGARIRGEVFSIGSGSTYAQAILDAEENKHGMSEEEAVALGIRAIRHATFRDAYSGGYIGVYLVTKDGWKK
eukprot:CAMPEP_0194275146 /NCGR_PEP_ID=MMETSP0169-20130528/8055_1 /TAXON_ID=218684 /ORGANISM="Corethron pennatum, Strain L29A3" /LENGTH=1405 /DNA_ID=CAMNT_0039018539 /DNA_START=66 /DNA_END=4280 /DNA_ORIENTATION=-